VKTKFDVYLIEVLGVRFISGNPATTGNAKTIGVAKGVEFDFLPFDNSEEVEKLKARYREEIEKLNKKLEEIEGK